MVETDGRELEKARIERLVKEMEPLAVIKWDESRAPTYIRFRVEVAGTILLDSSGDWKVSDTALKNNDDVKAMISATSGGRLK
jgi:hypothetical protein